MNAKIDIDEQVLELRVALNKATAASDVLTEQYFLDSEPDATILAMGYKTYQSISEIIGDMLSDINASLKQIEAAVIESCGAA